MEQLRKYANMQKYLGTDYDVNHLLDNSLCLELHKKLQYIEILLDFVYPPKL